MSEINPFPYRHQIQGVLVQRRIFCRAGQESDISDRLGLRLGLRQATVFASWSTTNTFVGESVETRSERCHSRGREPLLGRGLARSQQVSTSERKSKAIIERSGSTAQILAKLELSPTSPLPGTAGPFVTCATFPPGKNLGMDRGFRVAQAPITTTTVSSR
jgi:hypothetical protein